MFWDAFRLHSRILAKKVYIFIILGGNSNEIAETNEITGILQKIHQEIYAFPCVTATFCEGTRKDSFNAISLISPDFL